MTTGGATAAAGTNIALCKYWGKRDAALNLPASGSLSLTLAELGTRTTVRFLPDGPDGATRVMDHVTDRVTIDGAPADPKTTTRVSGFLDLVRARAGIRQRAEVTSTNTVPTASGLASSASAFAALALAATRAAGLALGPAELSALARRGSGSAARSIFGGFVELRRGEKPDGSDAVAVPLEGGEWDVRMVVALTASGPKLIGSREAMERTARTSPYYPAWLERNERDLDEARAAVRARDLPRLGMVAERSCLRMHAAAMAAEPPILYFNAGTLAAVHKVLELRTAGLAVYFTIDAGPHVKVLCPAPDAKTVEEAFGSVPGVLGTVVTSPGPGATVIEAAA